MKVKAKRLDGSAITFIFENKGLTEVSLPNGSLHGAYVSLIQIDGVNHFSEVPAEIFEAAGSVAAGNALRKQEDVAMFETLGIDPTTIEFLSS